MNQKILKKWLNTLQQERNIHICRKMYVIQLDVMNFIERKFFRVFFKYFLPLDTHPHFTGFYSFVTFITVFKSAFPSLLENERNI